MGWMDPDNFVSCDRAAFHRVWLGFGLPTAREEAELNMIVGPLRPLFIDRPDLTHRALQQLKPILEAWSGMELLPSIAYGFRLYRCWNPADSGTVSSPEPEWFRLRRGWMDDCG
jgi:hypothetical protein